MNIIRVIKSAVKAINSDAQVFLQEKSRDENEALEYTKPIINIFPDWTTKNTVTAAGFTKTTTYNIDFKKSDQWDNSDSDNTKSYAQTSAEIIEEMEVLADSVINWIRRSEDYPEINDIKQWNNQRPILRENNGTMSGTRIVLTVTYRGTIICSY